MAGNAALLIDLENFYIGRENLYHGTHPDETYEFPVDLDSLCTFAGDIAAGRRLVVRRAYANFNDRRPGEGDRRWDYYLQPQPRFLMEQGIEPVQVFRFPGGSNKNAADMRLAMDATVLLADRVTVDQFIIVTGDSDFIPLVLELKRCGAEVVVIGVTGCTKPIFARYCDRFEYFEDLLAARELQKEDHSELQPVRQGLLAMLGRRAPIKFAAVKPMLADELGQPFDPSRFGSESTGEFLRRWSDALGIVVRRGEHDWEIDLAGTPRVIAVGGEDPAASADPAGSDDGDPDQDADRKASSAAPPPIGAGGAPPPRREHAASLYADLLRQGIPRCYIVGYDDWNMIIDAVWSIVTGERAEQRAFFHQELLSEVTEVCSERGMADAPRKVRDVMFLLFKAGCFHCADEGSPLGKADFHWSRSARLDPDIVVTDKMAARAWSYLVDLLVRRLEQRGLGNTVQVDPLVELFLGSEPARRDVEIVRGIVAARG